MQFIKTTPEDIEILMDIRLEMLRKVNGLDEGFQFSDELVECSRRYFLDGDQTTVIAVENGRAVSCASISYTLVMPTFSHPTGKRAHLMNVYTVQEFRRQGIAAKLVKMLIDDARHKGVTEISLDSTDSGRPLYEALGFSPSSECMVKLLERNG